MADACRCRCGHHADTPVQTRPAAVGPADSAAARPAAARPPAGARPAALAALRPVHLDVRPDIREGREPFERIMTAVRTLAADEVLVVRAPFEPIPLYDVLGRRGLGHWTERHDATDWAVWFYRLTGAAGEPAARPVAPSSAEVGSVIIDVRGLEPPQPMLRVLERLDTLGDDQALVVIHDRRPLFLYPQLEERGFAHETEDVAPRLVRIVIRAAGRRAREA